MLNLERCSTLALLASLLVAPAATAQTKARTPKPSAGMVRVGPGVYRPLYPASPEEREVRVAAFLLDVRPVTNAEFSSFVRARPEWRRDRVKRLFADAGYLSHWKNPLGPGVSAELRTPVTHVSWFAAKAYCAARGARLPSEREWELAARSDDDDAEAASREQLLAWYAEPANGASLRNAGSGAANRWGARDLHGLVWEWVYDYGASLVTSDSREKDGAGSRFCGGAGANARDPSDYAAFMRIAFRSSLQAAYTGARLGFRCARDIAEESSS